VDQSNYQSYHLSTSHKTINLKGGSQVEDFLEVEDSPEAEDFLEAEEDSQAEEDTQVEEEYHLEDHQEEAGDRHHCPCHKLTKESW